MDPLPVVLIQVPSRQKRESRTTNKKKSRTPRRCQIRLQGLCWRTQGRVLLASNSNKCFPAIEEEFCNRRFPVPVVVLSVFGSSWKLWRWRIAWESIADGKEPSTIEYLNEDYEDVRCSFRYRFQIPEKNVTEEARNRRLSNHLSHRTFMETQASWFDSSETMATLLASTSLLSESWRTCGLADLSGKPELLCRGDMAYVAFPGNQEVDLSTGLSDRLEGGPFSPLSCHVGDDLDETKGRIVMVHGELLRLFMDSYARSEFWDQMKELLGQCKLIVITGHSIGATTASLTALWLLCQSIASPNQVLCITFGSPLLGNGTLSLVVLQQRWSGNFCHVISKLDIMPRLCLASLNSFSSHVQQLLRVYWSCRMAPDSEKLIENTDREYVFQELFRVVLSQAEVAAYSEGYENQSFRPFGSYLFCSEDGAICIDTPSSVLMMMYLMLRSGSPSCSIRDHLKYGDYTSMLSMQYLSIRSSEDDDLSESSYRSSVSFALQSIAMNSRDINATCARDSLHKARQMGLTLTLNCADLAIKLSKIAPHRAQLEWYKTHCDEAEEHLGYYDTFKKMGSGALKREYVVNMNLYKLGAFWDNVIAMVERNELPHYFPWLRKWLFAAQSYRLLAEPLEIARYYRSGMRHQNGHYQVQGRERRFKVLEKWWKERRSDREPSKRDQFASLTQDPLFWARLEEAKEWLESATNESDPGKLRWLLKELRRFEEYVAGLVERKEVSVDVLAWNSSYRLWEEDWRLMKLQSLHLPDD